MSADHWTTVRTKNGFAADEIISALQKEIRRGNTENAALLAYEMLSTNEELEEKLWERLLVISVEDIGWGDLQAPVLIESLYRIHERLRKTPDKGMFAVHAVRFLCSCEKDRSTDEMYSWIKMASEKKGTRPVIPDYALDMHTARGAGMGRGYLHFLEEAAKVEPELKDRTNEYLKRILTLLKD